MRSVGWRPLGFRKVVKNVEPDAGGTRWCRLGKEKRVGSYDRIVKWRRRGQGRRDMLNSRSSPTTARNPSNESSS